ncbi:MAG: hypothetical protein LBS82_05285 [Spirochaetaceae bacterium]|jgi:putative molybdopterin biosynthesis protein|nr:hypothetical protein [Spirochaetaceae bacterium]
MQKRNLNLPVVPVADALSLFTRALGASVEARFKTVATGDSLGRVLGAAVYARSSSPMFNASAMDGIAVRSEVFLNAGGEAVLLHEADFASVNTGDPVKRPFDAVVMAEDVVEREAGAVEVRARVACRQNVRMAGEDVASGEMLLPSRHVMRPVDIGLLLAGNIAGVEVYRRPRAAILPTGTELRAAGSGGYEEGDIIESNGGMLRAMAEECGAVCTLYPPTPDDPAALRDALKEALSSHDLVVVNAASSAGTEDYTVGVLRELGEVVVHGVAMKPGRPVILAVAGGKPVIGAPGYPVAAHLSFRLFAAPLLRNLSGLPDGAPVVRARLSGGARQKPPGAREYLRVRVSCVDGAFHAQPLGQGSSSAASLVKADGLCLLGESTTRVEAGEIVPVELIRPLEAVERTLVLRGPHDTLLDIVRDMMSEGGHSLSSAGEADGLPALERGECHIAAVRSPADDADAGAHLKDLEARFPGESIALIKGCRRQAGILVAPGNPLVIRSRGDLAACRLAKDEGSTQSALAAAVASGSADAGLGSPSAARNAGLDFVPLDAERYDFVCRARHVQLPACAAFIQTLQSAALRRRLEEAGGYDPSGCGETRTSGGAASA